MESEKEPIKMSDENTTNSESKAAATKDAKVDVGTDTGDSSEVKGQTDSGVEDSDNNKQFAATESATQATQNIETGKQTTQKVDSATDTNVDAQTDTNTLDKTVERNSDVDKQTDVNTTEKVDSATGSNVDTYTDTREDSETDSDSDSSADEATNKRVAMGAGASQDEVLIDDTEEGAGTSQSPGTIKQRPNMGRQMSKGSNHEHHSARSDSGEDSVVTVTHNGFSVPEVVIMEGQFVSFVWEDSRAKLDVVQVIHDSEKLRPVIGGYEAKAEDAKGQYDQQFNLEGEYKFAIHGIRCTPLTVNVKRRVDLLVGVVDDGFKQNIIYIDQGHTIKFEWKDCQEPHSVQEVKYCIDKKAFKRDADNQSNVVKTVTGNYRKTFPRPGLFFFQTESKDLNHSHMCVVHVREAQREFKVEILDRSFQPMIVLIDEGDRVWWYWDKFKCKKPHSVYQIEAPPIDQEDDEPYEPVSDGFRWATPSKQGLMSHEFFKPGVYYFSDQNLQEAAEYIGTIIVKPKQKEHYIELTEKGGFEQDLVNAVTGDRVWFHWDKEEARKKNKSFAIAEIEKCLNPTVKEPENDDADYQFLDEKAMKLCTDVGLATTNYNTIGVYHYRVADGPPEMNTCSVIVNPGSKNHTIHLTENGFEPKVITVRPNDRVWWVWQSGKKQHNIVQVSHQGSPIDGGFCSGMVRDPPSAFVHQFVEPGVFYFISSSIPKVFGAIVVSTQPQVHEVHVSMEIKPDPVTIKLNDIVCWIFRQVKKYDITEIETVDQLTAGFTQHNTVTPRRCLNRAITRTGLIHYCSKSFSLKKDTDTGDMRETRFSSVVCDERYDNTVIRVDKDGFHPHFAYIIKGQSVLWTWKGTDDESHNIIHVSSADSKEPLNIIHGAKSFNSGKPVPSNSFLYTFDDPGSYTVASQGAPGYSCTVFVLRSGSRVREPYMKNNGGQVKRFSKVDLFVDSPGAKIFYTTDGSPPELHLDSAKMYRTEKGLVLRDSGLCFVRAMAVLEGSINSHIFTSKRFWVLPDENEDRKSITSSASEADEKPAPSKGKNWDWWDCAPTIKACFTSPGVIEVFWDPPEKEQISLIRGYEVFLNGVTYCDMFPATNNSVCVSGLAGGRLYEIWVEAYATKDGLDPQVSNKMMMKCAKQTREGGPVISLERTEKPEALAVVWMSIDSRDYPISGYLIFLNEQQCGSRLVPDPNSDRCKVVIGGCALNQLHRVYVVALPRGEVDDGRRSNILEVTLPLDFEQVELPPEEERADEPELYVEYLEVREGSGYITAMDDILKQYASRLGARKGTPRSPSPSTGDTSSSVDTEDQRDRVRASDTDQKSQESSSDDRSVSTASRMNRSRRRKEFDREGVDYKEYSRTDPRRQHSTPSETEDSEDDEDSSETESETDEGSTSASETESRSVATFASRGSMTIINAKKPWEEHKSERSSKRESTKRAPAGSIDQAREVVVDRVPEDSITHASHVRSQPRMEVHQHPHKPRLAIIEVQDSVELDEGRVEATGMEERRVAVSADKNETKRLVDEGEMVEKDQDGTLPAPAIMVSTLKKGKIKVQWKLPKKMDSEYKLLLYVVNIVGPKFSPSLRSDHSFECSLIEKGKQMAGVQHCWNIQEDDQLIINGLMSGQTYRVFVIANYTTLQGSHPYAVQTTSSVIYYTTMGPPESPNLRIVSVDLYQALLEWDPPKMHRDLLLKGYQMYVDGKRLPGALRPPDTRQVLIKEMVPGKTMHVKVVAVAKQGNIESEPSREIHITCPRRPPPPAISNQPSYKTGCVLVAWTKPAKHMFTNSEDEITLYEVYTDNKWYGKLKANNMSNRDGYQFFLNNLSPERSYDVGVKCIAGNKQVDPHSNHVYCLSASDMSNVLSVLAPSVPRSPNLRLEGLNPRGIEVTWQIPQEMGEVKLSGYQMLKNGQLYGGIIPADSSNLCISDVMLGETVTLQLIALTEHPIGKMEQQIAERNAAMDPSKDNSAERSVMVKFTNDVDLPTQGWPVSSRSLPAVFEEFLGNRYAGCRPGVKLVVHYSGLVLAPESVWTEQVTGHSALIVWTKEDEPRKHYVCPDSYQVTWWPGEHAQNNINSDSTTDDHLLISGLKSDTAYTVVVEARKMEKYKQTSPETPGREKENVFILTAKSENITVKTAKPPSKPSNIGVSANTCHSLRVEWDPPRDNRIEIIGIRVDAVSLNSSDPHHVSYDVIPDVKSVDVEGLKEKTEYLIRITAVTDEYFDRLPDRHKYKKARTLPRDIMVPPQESPWLPNDYIIQRTAGTEPPSNLKITRSSTTTMTLSWIPPITYGSNKLKNIIVRWADVKNAKKGNDEVQMSSYKTLDSKDTATTITDLVPGTQYKIVVEAVVSIKTALVETQEKDMERYRRTAHVMSKPLYSRARAPTEAPKLYVTEFTQSTAQLYWEKPILVSSAGKDEDGKPKYLRRYLEGYKLEINGTTHCCLGPNRQSCALKKCKPGKEYTLRLVALTCTDDGKKERKKKYKGFFAQTNQDELDYTTLLDDEENLDASPSDPVELVLPRVQPGNVESVKAVFLHTEDIDCKIFGNLQVVWTVQGDASLIKDFNIKYMVMDDETVRQVRGASASARQIPIPVERLKSVYQISVEPNYYTETLPQRTQTVQLVIPGPPDAPEIFTKTVTPEEFVIEWGEPRLYGGVKVRGYQVYLNDKKAGNELSASHRKAVIPCRPSRTYKINLVALSISPEYEDSLKSNTLMINTSPHSPRQAQALDDWTPDDADVPVKVTQVTDTSVHLDWSKYLEVEEVVGYKIEWSSVAQPTQRSLNLDRENNSCIINNCLPGTTHFVRLIALDGQGKELERSRQITVQTSAPPEPPVLTLRACNFRYIAVQWEKPTTYGDAMVTGYKVFVNGIVQHTLNADQLSFTYTEGKWCHEYTFQVQAVTAVEKLYSKVSEPLTVMWPGAQGPHLQRLPTHSSSVIRIGWDDITSTEGVKVKHFRGICTEEETEKIIYNFPIHPESREVEFPDLKNRVYNIYLEVHLYGTSDVIRSEILRIQPAPAPDPPRVSVTVVGLDERRQLDKVTCDLVNKRDRLIRKVGHKLKEIGALSHPLRAEKNKEVIDGAHTLTRVEELLERCFIALDHFTGQLIAHVSWHCPQSRPEFQISGYKVLIDGKQYGSPMHEGVKTIRINLPVDSPRYKLSLVSMTERPQATSAESNSVELLAENFRPFPFYCYHSIHCKDVKWPNQGCCKYQDSIMYERQLAKKLANQGLLKKRVPPPSCSLLDIFEGEYKPLLGTHNKQFPTVILFWTPWCLSSQKVIGHFVRFGRENSSQHNFIAVTCGVDAVGANERKSLIHQITSNGWRADGVVWHCTSQCASSIQEASNNVWKNTPGGQVRKADDGSDQKFVDLTEILGIAGVPTLLFIHPDGYIAWHGRYSAFDYASYAAFMQHTFSEIAGSPCSVFKCDSCQNDVTIDEEGIEPILQVVNDTRLRTMPPRLPSEIISTEQPINTIDDEAMKRMFYKRKPSPKGKKKPNKTISVNHRPYSASSTYVQLLKSPYMQQVVPSPKALNRLLRPSSASHLG